MSSGPCPRTRRRSVKARRTTGGGGAQPSASGRLQTVQRRSRVGVASSACRAASPSGRAPSRRPGARSLPFLPFLPTRSVWAYLYGSHSSGRCGMPASSAASATLSSSRSLPKYDCGRGGDAVRARAVEDLVEVGGDDRLLALLAGEGLRQLEGLDDLQGLAGVQALLRVDRPCSMTSVRQEPTADELLGDRGGAAAVAAAAELRARTR